MVTKKPNAKVDRIFDELSGKAAPVIIRREKDFERFNLRKFRAEALVKQNYKCRYCRDLMTSETVTAEHKKPKYIGGRTEANNIAASCYPCNNAKQTMTDGEFMREVKQPRRTAHINIWRAHIRRKLNLATERACRNILRAVGMPT